MPLPGPLETSAAGSTAGRVDPAGSWILEACVSVADGSKPELMDRAFGELDAFKDLLDGVVRFRGVDRLVLDSRVRNPGDGSGGAMDKMGMGRGIGVRT